jgi:hypothetical protein
MRDLASFEVSPATTADTSRAGGLTPDLQKQFDVASGRISDQYARSGRSLSAALANRRAQSGGALTPAAIAEMQSEGQTQANEDYFDASNSLAAQKANLSYTATRDWYSQLQNIQETITQTGLTREQQAMLAKLQTAGLMFQRDKSYRDNATSLAGSLGGGIIGGLL